MIKSLQHTRTRKPRSSLCQMDEDYNASIGRYHDSSPDLTAFKTSFVLVAEILSEVFFVPLNNVP